MSDYAWAAEAGWASAWDGVAALVGTDVRPNFRQTAADEIEIGAIRRFLEPLEFDSPIHYDRASALSFGYPDVIAPYSGCASWTSPALWSPSDAAYYTTDDRDAQPDFRVSPFPTVGPDTDSAVATDLETEFFAPFVVGDRPYLQGSTLLSCLPKETKVGRGAFMTWESDVRSAHDDLIAQVRMSLYFYVSRNTFEPQEGDDSDDE